MLLRSKIIFRCIDWWSIAFLLLCSTKFLAGGSLPVLVNEDLIKELENDLQESENDQQKSDYESRESEIDLQETHDNFEIQPRSLTVLAGIFLAKFFGKKLYRMAKNQNQAGHQPPQMTYPQNQYPPNSPPLQYGAGYPPPVYYPPPASKPPSLWKRINKT